ncbi:MAG: hypothetical protein DRI61_12985 [Chloroflexi bacterium]|nr:MAG: hypothetical protein DRI61_12985 [Chloroflexota bacterium]
MKGTRNVDKKKNKKSQISLVPKVFHELISTMIQNGIFDVTPRPTVALDVITASKSSAKMPIPPVEIYVSNGNKENHQDQVEFQYHLVTSPFIRLKDMQRCTEPATCEPISKQAMEQIISEITSKS